MIIEKVKLWSEKFSEAWLACMVCMVQGDLTVLSLYHAGVASKTGAIAGLVIVLTSYVNKLNNIWMNAWLTVIATALADLLFVKSHFGAWWTEAVVTGIGAGLLAILFHKLFGERKWLK